jgi:hypothetical protein
LPPADPPANSRPLDVQSPEGDNRPGSGGRFAGTGGKVAELSRRLAQCVPGRNSCTYLRARSGQNFGEDDIVPSTKSWPRFWSKSVPEFTCDLSFAGRHHARGLTPSRYMPPTAVGVGTPDGTSVPGSAPRQNGSWCNLYGSADRTRPALA